ncbi:hypothetical protein EV385_0588 [Krasilnikovia cinnamomea]|uniref:DUF2637 domain-containing protein n=1 Tax=Krasilnikovia cinnamomea TaxID=349313 RepID=A0A4Q7ZFU1_9ACTN|nr:DUF2637 domain-containing protein [Krasilnikovia cinnamomea]RZU48859.1 hypothetical protein EV385_0588 [Krasilnikovia cinnamomea]
MRKPAVSGRVWAYIGALLGGIVSIAANVAHSYVPPPDAPPDWSPQGGAVVGAIFWPVALFVAVEILARTAWPTGRRWSLLRFGGLVPVAGVAAFVSYKHLSGLLAFYGEDGLTATLGPLAVDGLMVMATGALLATARRTTAADPEPVTVPAAVTVTAPAPTPDPAAHVTKPVKAAPAKRVTRKPASAEKVARAAAKMPGASVAAIAAKAGVSESTARRHMPAPPVAVTSPIAPVPAETPTLTAA